MRLAKGTPVLLLCYGFPLWWALGLGEASFLLAAAAMSVSLWRERERVRVPRGFGLWLLFLLAVAVSSMTLGERAPGAAGTGSLLTYGYRVAWYLAVTVALLYVGNLDDRVRGSRRIPEALAFLFLVTVAGGLAGMAFPSWEAKSLVERLLPSGLASHDFVQSLVHLDAADVQDVLGYAEARPKLPFAYANAWGANFATLLPFFLYAWFVGTPVWRRVLALPILAAGSLVAVATLNRALWAALAVAGAYAAIQVVRLLGRRGLVAVYAVGAAGLAILLLSGLPTVIGERLANPHSNDRRAELALRTVDAVAAGSPLIGFGNTRRVEGSFASISGGSSEDCPDCGVPPMGTQGHLWLVLFAQGVVGVVSFFGFVLYRMGRHVRSRDPRTVFLLAVPLFLLFQAPFYDLLGPPLFTTMVALGLMWGGPEVRPTDLGDEGHRRAAPESDAIPVSALMRQARRDAPAVLGFVVIALAVGALVLAATPPRHTASVDVFVPAAPVHLDEDGAATRVMSLDTEAQRVLSDPVMAAITSRTGAPNPRNDVRVRAYPLTSVLRLSYTAGDPTSALEGVRAMALRYASIRAAALQIRAARAVTRLASVDVATAAARGRILAGSPARERWAQTVDDHERRLSAASAATPLEPEIVAAPRRAAVENHMAMVAANAVMLGTLLGLATVRYRQRPGRRRS